MDVSFEKYFCLDQKKIVSKVIWKLVISSDQIVIAPGNIVISSGQIYLNLKKMDFKGHRFSADKNGSIN